LDLEGEQKFIFLARSAKFQFVKTENEMKHVSCCTVVHLQNHIIFRRPLPFNTDKVKYISPPDCYISNSHLSGPFRKDVFSCA